MNLQDASTIAGELLSTISPVCEEAIIVGSVRRRKHDVHDLEFLCKPIGGVPIARFGDKVLHKTFLDKQLYEIEKEGIIIRIGGGEKLKKYYVNTARFGIASLNYFKIEFYCVTWPAQWGVLAVIRTGPGSDTDNFSTQCVANRSDGGYLPDGYKVKHGAVWLADQLDPKMNPKIHEIPLPMPEEIDFLKFLGLGWIEPQYRHANWRRNGRA